MIEEIIFRDIPEYINAIQSLPSLLRCQSNDIWYRGVSDVKYSLIPRLIWRKITDENSLICDFLIDYRTYYENKITDGLELYVLMQHYGLPTRLLDWTKSPLMALFFSLEKEEDHPVQQVVWAMDVIAFNSTTIGEKMVVVPKQGDFCFVKKYLPDMLRESINEKIPETPFALEPMLSNARIRAQQGCFTLHGTETKTIDAYLAGEASPKIVKLLLNDSTSREKLVNHLYTLGIREDSVYQDLDSLSKRIIRERI